MFVGTWRPDQSDAEMVDRVKRHQKSRPAWRVLDAPIDVAEALSELKPSPSGVVMDCLTLWLSARLDWEDDEILEMWDDQLAHFKAAPWPMVIVGNEVGWSLVPEDAVLRRFRDLAGSLGQRTAAAADEAWLMVAGRPVRLR